MKIGVCAKVSLDADARVVVNPDGNSVNLDGAKLVIGDYDQLAIEQAIRTKEAHGGEVVSYTLGATSDEKQLRSGALALGVDRSVLVNETVADPLGIAKLLAAAIQKDNCDVVFTGKCTTDSQNFQVGAMIAELLGWAHVGGITQLAFEGSNYKATRNVDGGAREVVQGSLPAVFACEDGLCEVRYAKLPAIMKAKKMPFDTFSAGDLGASAGDARLRESNLAPPAARPAGRILEGDAATVAKELVRLLREEAKVL